MNDFATQPLPLNPDVQAPDGSNVRILQALKGGSMAHFELPPGKTSIPVAHRTVEEIWFILEGTGEMWRKQGDRESVTPLTANTCITIPLDTHFQFKSTGPTALTAIAITMPPWPNMEEAYPVEGKWPPSL